jgi:hypothetical protein
MIRNRAVQRQRTCWKSKMEEKQLTASQAPAPGKGECSDEAPPENAILDRLLDPVTRCLTPEVAQQLVALRADPQLQERLDTLADKCTEGLLSADEREEYETYVQAVQIIAILQAKARKLLANPPSS